MTLASVITLHRLLLVPVFVAFAIAFAKSLDLGEPVPVYRNLAIVSFTVASLSDALDGWVARRFSQVSRFGAILDPIADKSLIWSAFAVLTFWSWGPGGTLPIWFLLLLIARDLMILGGIAYLKTRQKQIPIKPRLSGKLCTLSQFVLLAAMMFQVSWVPIAPLVYLSSFTILWSAAVYYRDGLTILRS